MPQPTPDDQPAPDPHNDQEIDTAGTEADENAHDIVGPTGEEMPDQKHDGVETPKATTH